MLSALHKHKSFCLAAPEREPQFMLAESQYSTTELSLYCRVLEQDRNIKQFLLSAYYVTEVVCEKQNKTKQNKHTQKTNKQREIVIFPPFYKRGS